MEAGLHPLLRGQVAKAAEGGGQSWSLSSDEVGVQGSRDEDRAESKGETLESKSHFHQQW